MYISHLNGANTISLKIWMDMFSVFLKFSMYILAYCLVIKKIYTFDEKSLNFDLSCEKFFLMCCVCLLASTLSDSVLQNIVTSLDMQYHDETL